VKEVGVNGRLVISGILSRWKMMVVDQESEMIVIFKSYLLVGLVDKRMEDEW
jgi:hypothetical protein